MARNQSVIGISNLQGTFKKYALPLAIGESFDVSARLHSLTCYAEFKRVPSLPESDKSPFNINGVGYEAIGIIRQAFNQTLETGKPAHIKWDNEYVFTLTAHPKTRKEMAKKLARREDLASKHPVPTEPPRTPSNHESAEL